MNEELTRTPLFQSLTRPHLVMGGERELVLLSGIFTFALIVTTMSVMMSAIALVVWVLSLWALRRMAKADSQLSRVYVRAVRRSAYYPARSTPFRRM
jgi:type IV secretory pathway TrbD component